jgi:hypothetical protein
MFYIYYMVACRMVGAKEHRAQPKRITDRVPAEFHPSLSGRAKTFVSPALGSVTVECNLTSLLSVLQALSFG